MYFSLYSVFSAGFGLNKQLFVLFYALDVCIKQFCKVLFYCTRTGVVSIDSDIVTVQVSSTSIRSCLGLLLEGIKKLSDSQKAYIF